MRRLKRTSFLAADGTIQPFSAGAVDRFGKGWESGYAIIDEMLAELRAK